jgi:Type II secretion system (T2SS), protein N
MSRTSRLSLIGVATFAVCLIALAPASLVTLLLRDAHPLSLATPTGTFWRGSGELAYAGMALGRLRWSFAPLLVLSGQVGFDITLDGRLLKMTGRAGSSAGAANAQLQGEVDAALLAEPLARYDITLPGSLTVRHIELTYAYGRRLPAVRGDLKWSGGAVSYRLAGRDHRIALPVLVGFLDSSSGQPEMTVYQADDKTPLMLARVTEDGLATVGITKQFTKLLGEPWPGSEPDHAVVLEVGEKLF